MNSKKKEVWKPIKYNPKYSVSSHGRIRGIYKTINGYLRKPQLDKDGYPRILLHKDGQKLFGVHRLVAEAFLPKPEGKDQVNHKNGNKADNRVENLEWCTLSENRQHAFKTGLQSVPNGHLSPAAKLTKKQVADIRKKYKPRVYTLEMLADEYGVVFQTVSKVINFQTYGKR